MPSQSAVHIGALIQGSQGQGLQSSFLNQKTDLATQAALSGNTDAYTKQANAMETVTNLTASVAVAQGKANIATADYIKLANILLNATDAERDRITLLTSEINTLTGERDKAEGAARTQISNEIAGYTKELNLLIGISEASAAVRKAREDYKGFTSGPTDNNGSLLSSGQVGFKSALEQAYKDQAKFAQVQGIDPETLKKAFADPVYIAFADGYQKVEGLTSDFQKELIDSMKKTADEISKTMNFSFKDLGDTSVSSFDAIQQKAKYYEQFLQKQYGPAGYKEDKQNVGLLFKDNQAKVINTTMTALTLALQDLTEVEKKQLEGQWNLPSGLSAYVPITSLFYSQQNNKTSQNGTTQELSTTTIIADQFGGSVTEFTSAVAAFAGAIPDFERRFLEKVAPEDQYHKISSSTNKYANANQAEGAGFRQYAPGDTTQGYTKVQESIGWMKSPNNANQAEHLATDVYKQQVVHVDVAPQSITVSIDGKAVANATARYNASTLKDTSRARGKSPATIN
jgi:hypothetical protein